MNKLYFKILNKLIFKASRQELDFVSKLSKDVLDFKKKYHTDSWQEVHRKVLEDNTSERLVGIESVFEYAARGLCEERLDHEEFLKGDEKDRDEWRRACETLLEIGDYVDFEGKDAIETLLKNTKTK